MLTLIVYCIVRHLLYTTTYTRSDWSAKGNNSVNTDRTLLFVPLRKILLIRTLIGCLRPSLSMLIAYYIVYHLVYTTYARFDWLPEV